MDGPDNAVAVRSVADVTGDGRDEVLVGVDESGVDNVFLLDGASSGAATQVWAVETTGGVSGGSPYGDACLSPISDTDGNGAPEILVGTAWGGRTAYSFDADAGAERWRFDTYQNPPDSGWVYSLTQLDDTTGDGVPEVAFVAGSDADSVYAVDGGSSGAAALLWRYQAADGAVWIADLGDVDGDGAHDPVVAVGDLGRAVVALDGDPPTATGVPLWTYPTGTSSVWAVGTIPDLTGDGRSEALAAIWTIAGSAIRALDGATGALVWASTEVFDYGMLVDLLPDVTGDGDPEVVVSTWENAAQVLDGATGERLWKRVVGTENGGDVWSSRAIPDLNGDGRADVLAGSFDGYVYAFSGVNGYPFWSYDTANRIYSVAPLGDLDGDGIAEAGAATQDTTSQRVLYVFSGDAGTTLPLFADDFENGEPVGWAAIEGGLSPRRPGSSG
jgi:outer membrane protein assembly factor BamB